VADLTEKQVSDALRRLGHYRVITAQTVALDGDPDDISGALLLALGLRESLLQNINNSAETDHGCFQISELYHLAFLRSEPGCPAGTWKPRAGHTADETGYCPRYTPALMYAERMLISARAYAASKGIPKSQRVPFAVAAYNAGVGGATRGYSAGDVDRYTTGRDYSAWVIRHKVKIHRWLTNPDHRNWLVVPE
jgi:hypothetical protein